MLKAGREEGATGRWGGGGARPCSPPVPRREAVCETRYGRAHLGEPQRARPRVHLHLLKYPEKADDEVDAVHNEPDADKDDQR